MVAKTFVGVVVETISVRVAVDCTGTVVVLILSTVIYEVVAIFDVEVAVVVLYPKAGEEGKYL